jgi:uncharacterized protein YcbK (DUF882 family)
MSNLEDYTAYLEGLNLTYFSPREVTSYADRVRNGVRNSLPPRRLWRNIAEPLRIADMAREIAGVPIKITSAYRSEDYNRACGGVKFSQHKENRALDLIPVGITTRKLDSVLRRLRADGEFSGGLGLYNSFVHIDTRGRNATWGKKRTAAR